eukprot:TRINITY_DN25216_c0_g1_i2.p1 TRINITY_DN25216_c0_g1~~TRINITY_DN25216_c0_g1_i2.p1  ORF type:complete len:251 (-),score=56.63 TRINITY_DN25216_c0_g1_i2:24-707(-)
MPSAFEELCAQRGVVPEEWRKSLATPIIAEKCLLDMSEEELEEHYRRAQERAENTREDRSLLVLERTQDGRLERQANKAWDGIAEREGRVTADQVHYLLAKFDATEGCDMIPEAEFTLHQWLWIVGECQILKETYRHVSKEEWEAQYEEYVQQLGKEEPEGKASKKTSKPQDNLGWWWTHGEKADHASALRKFAWGMQPELEEELLKQMELFLERGRQDSARSSPAS